MNSKTNKGITLIALVITIIVLLILAGVTISMVLGDDGIIAQAQNAKQQHEDASVKDAMAVAKGEATLAQHIEQTPMSYADLSGKFNFTAQTDYKNNVAKVVDGVPIPVGFAYVEGTKKDTGLIIVDGLGNEFVWVPVDDFTKFAKEANTGEVGDWQGILYDVKSEGTMQEKTAYGQDTTSYREPANLSTSYDNTTNLPEFNNDLFQDEYNEMAESVRIYKGFYVGRYETGGFNSTKVVSKAGEDQASCTNVTWYKMYKMQKELYGENASVTSGMIYGAQWDAIMDWMKDVPNVTDSSKKYIKDSTNMGNYAEICPSCDGGLCEECDQMGIVGNSIKTGSNPAYSVKNIFDLAGNYIEWTQEAYSTNSRIFRGGDFYGEGDFESIFRRDYTRADNAGESLSSRLQLYIK